MNHTKLSKCFTLALSLFCSANMLNAAETFNTGDKTLYSCDFEDLTFSKQNLFQFELTDQIYTQSMKEMGFNNLEPWLLYLQDTYTSANHFAGAASVFTEGGAANSWLVTDKITIGENSYLSWLSQASSLSKRDGLKIFISTKGIDPEKDFDLDNPLVDIKAESAGIKAAIDDDWTSHEVSLKDYAGQDVYIAFVNQSVNKEIICLDDIAVVDKTLIDVTSATPKVAIENQALISCTVTAKEININNIKAYYQGEDNVVKSVEFNNLSVAPGETYTFSFPDKYTLTKKGEYNSYKLWVSANGGTNVGVNDSIAYTSFIPSNKVVLEEGTGVWCGFCVEGILAIDYVHSKYPDNFIPIAVHNGDPMCVDYYDRGLGFEQATGFPIGLINRSFLAHPIVNDSFENPGGTVTFYDGVASELQKVPSVQVDLEKASYQNDGVKEDGSIIGGRIEVTSNVRFPFSKIGSDYSIAYVLLEDNVTSFLPQKNYHYNSQNPIYGDFGANGIYNASEVKNYKHQHVARGIYPTINGMMNFLPSDCVMDETYTVNYTIDLSSTYIQNKFKGNTSVVVMIMDAANNMRIINADVIKVSDDSGVSTVDADNQTIATFDGATLTACADNVTVNVFTTSGQCVKTLTCAAGENFDTAELQSGCYILKASNGNAQQVWKVVK